MQRASAYLRRWLGLLPVLLAAVVFAIAWSPTARAQTPTPTLDENASGTYYIVGFPDTTSNQLDSRYPNNRVRGEATLWIFSAVTNKVKVTGYGGASTVLNLEAGKFKTFTLTASPVIDVINAVSRKTFKVESDFPIVLYCYFANIQSLEAWTPAPVETWGTEYYAACVPGEIVNEIGIAGETEIPSTPKPGSANILVIAAYDNTKVSITPAGGNRFVGGPQTSVTLNEGEAYQVQSMVDTSADADRQPDLAGSSILADKPVAVISGNTRVQVVVDEVGLKNNAYKNMITEWMSPTEQHGKKFVYLPTWDNHRPGIGSSAERKREFARIYNTSGKPAPMKGYYLSPGGTSKVNFTAPGIKRDTIGEFAFGQPSAVYFETETPAMAMMHSSGIVKFNGSTPCFRGIPCLSYSSWAPYMVEMVPREQWVKFAPYYAPTNPGSMLHFISAVTDTVSMRSIVMQDGSPFPFTRRIPGTDLIWGSRSVTAGNDNWLMSKDTGTFTGVAFGLQEGGEEYRPGATKKKDGSKGVIAGGGGNGAPDAAHPCEYEEYNAVSYGYPLAPSRKVLKPADTLRIDTVMDCSELTITIRAINSNPVGLRSITLDPTSVDNAKLVAVNPLRLSDIIGKSQCTVKVVAIDPLKNASATIIIKDRTGKITKVYFKYEAEYVTTNPADSISFGSVNVGTSSDKDLTFTNPLTRDIKLEDILLAIGREYSIKDVQPRKPKTTIAPGETFTITVSVKPSEDNQRYVDTLKIKLGCVTVPIVLITETSRPCIYVGDLNFGQFLVGDGPKTLDLEVTNRGTGPLVFVDPVVTFPSADYSVPQSEKDQLKAQGLKPNESFTLHVTFTPPGVVGVYNITAHFFTNSTCIRDSSIWRAIVSKPGPRITDYDWKEQWLVTTNTCTKNPLGQYESLIYVYNRGDFDVTIKSLTLVDQDATDGYFKLDNSVRATSIQPGDGVRKDSTQTLLQKVLFLPKDERPYSCRAMLITTADGVKEDTIYSVLSGVGIESHGSIGGTRFDTAQFIPPMAPVTKRVVLRAKQTRPLTITGLQVSDPVSFSISPATLAKIPTTLQPGDSLDVDIQFHPDRAGEKSATVYFIGDHARCDDSTAPISGYTFTRGVVITNIDYGSKLTCGIDTQAVTLTNTGSEPLIVKGWTLNDPERPPVFTEVQDGRNNAALDTIQPNETKRVWVVFEPRRVGTFNATMNFDIKTLKDTAVIGPPALITGSGYIVTVHARIDTNHSGAPGAIVETPVILEESLDEAKLDRFFIGVLYNNKMMRMHNGTLAQEDIDAMTKGTLVEGWTLQIVEADHPEGEYLAVLTAPPGRYLQGTGKLLNPVFQLFLGTIDKGKISFYILPVGKQCARVIPSPGLARLDSVCGLNLRLIESSGFAYSLNQNKPNPFNPSTDITFSLGLDGPTKLVVYDASGKKVATLVDGMMKPGTYQVTWDASSFPSGLYYYRLESGVWTRTNSMILRK